MEVCNISFQIEPNVESIWLAWMKDQFIPSFESTGCFKSTHFYQLEVDDTQAPTYTLQLFAKDAETLATYRSTHAATLMYNLHNTWGEQCFHFSSYMQIVN